MSSGCVVGGSRPLCGVGERTAVDQIYVSHVAAARHKTFFRMVINQGGDVERLNPLEVEALGTCDGWLRCDAGACLHELRHCRAAQIHHNIAWCVDVLRLGVTIQSHLGHAES